jgi:two-component SAPR family response regulator
MPNISGFELYYKIRKLDNKVKICFLTASDLSEEIKREIFLDEYEKICFIKMPIANEDLS